MHIRGFAITTSPQGAMYVACPNQIFKLVPVALDTQIEQLLIENNYDDAEALLHSFLASNPSPSQEGQAAFEQRIKFIRLSNAYHLFVIQGQYQRALETFQDMNEDTIHVLNLYPNFLPKPLQAEIVKQQKERRAKNQELFQNYAHPVEPPSPLAGAALEKAASTLVQYLVKQKHLLEKNVVPTIDPAVLTEQIDGPFSNVTLLPVLVDTSLVKCYLTLKSNANAFLNALLKQKSFCNVKETESCLKDQKKIPELLTFYNSKKLHKKALLLLQE
jgi:hypothetical protein